MALGVVALLVGQPLLLWPGCGLILVGWLAGATRIRERIHQQGPLDLGWLALLLGSLLGYVVSFQQAAAGPRLAAVVAGITTCYWLQDRLQSPQRLRLAAWTLVAGCLAGALVVLALIRGQLPDSVLTRGLSPILGLFAVFPGVSGDVLEVNSRFPIHQYGLAFLLLVTIPFLMAQAALGRARIGGPVAAVGAAALAIVLAATEARGALLAAAFAVALVGSFRSRWFWALLPLGALALYLLLARGIISRSIEGEWLNTRLSIWSRSLYLLGDYPFSGAGLGMQTFAEVFAWNFGLPNPYLVVHSHNIFIQAYAEQGLLGLIGLLLVMAGALLLGWRAVRGGAAGTRVVTAGAFGALVATALYGLTDQVPTTNYGLLIVSALCGLAVAGARLPVAKLAENPPRPRQNARLGAVAAAGSLPVWRRGRAIIALAAVALLLATLLPRLGSGLALNAGAAQVTASALSGGLDSRRREAGLGRASAALEAAASWNPQNIPAYRLLARARLLRHDVPGAQAALDRARASSTLNDYERTQLGRVYLEMGYWQQAFDLWQAARQAPLLEQAADELARKREYKAAAAARAALADLEPDSAEHLANLARAILAAEGAVSADEAMRWFERAAERNPEARRGIARQLVLQAEDCRINERRGGGRFELCIFWFGLASRVDPSYDKPEVELGSVYYYARRYSEAASHFRAATERDPKNSSSWHQLGEAEQAAGRLPEAVAAFEQAVRVAPNRAGLHASLGRAYAQLGFCEAAGRELAEALRLEPGNALARTDRGGLAACG